MNKKKIQVLAGEKFPSGSNLIDLGDSILSGTTNSSDAVVIGNSIISMNEQGERLEELDISNPLSVSRVAVGYTSDFNNTREISKSADDSIYVCTRTGQKIQKWSYNPFVKEYESPTYNSTTNSIGIASKDNHIFTCSTSGHFGSYLDTGSTITQLDEITNSSLNNMYDPFYIDGDYLIGRIIYPYAIAKVDISDPTNIGTVSLHSTTYNVEQRLAVSNGYIFYGGYTTYHELNCIDVDTFTLQDSINLESAGLSNIKAFRIFGNVLYVIDTTTLATYDISDPSNITLIDTLAYSTSVADVERGVFVFKDNYAFMIYDEVGQADWRVKTIDIT